jgi:hypothetical protein
MHLGRSLFVLTVAGCAGSPAAVAPTPGSTPVATAPEPAPSALPPICEADLSAWSPEVLARRPAIVRALRPAVVALQARVCACAATTSLPESLGFAMDADPAAGRTQVTPDWTGSPCLGAFVATYPAFAFEGDVLTCDPTCHGQPATFSTRFTVASGAQRPPVETER